MKTTDPAEAQQLTSLRSYLAQLNRDEMETDPQTVVYKLLNEYRNTGRLLARLAVSDPDGEICSGALLVIFLALKDSQISAVQQAHVRAQAGGILEQALRDPDTSDDRKFMLGPAAFLCDIKMTEAEYRGLFQDFEKISARKFKEYAEGILDNPQSIDKILLSADGENHPALTPESLETELNRAGALCQHNPSVGATLLILTLAVAHAHGLPIADGEKVLEFAARTDPTRAAWYLSVLGRLPGFGPLGLTAARLSRHLAHSGARARCPIAGDFSHGWVSQTDGAGSRSVNLYFRTPEGGLDGLTLLINDELGIREIFCVFGEGAALEEEVRKRSHRVAFAPCLLEAARTLVCGALALHREQDRTVPPRFLLYRYLFGPTPLKIQPEPPRLGCYLLETVVFSPELLKESRELVESPLFGSLWCNSEAAYGFLNDRLEVRQAGATGRRKRSKRLKLGKRALKEYIQVVCAPDRAKLARRLAANLEFEAWRGRAKRPENRLAALVWLAIDRELMPFEDIPYVQGLAQIGVENISENIYYGYKSQAEVERASLELDDMTNDYIDELLDE
ncbi:MAG: hypothetical protein ACREJ2_07740 [Planctomycetota bacterium]